MLKGMGNFQGPPSQVQFKKILQLVNKSLPLFALSVIRDGIKNEDGLNRSLSCFITNLSRKNDLPFFSQNESMENEADGHSPATDIGIFLHIPDVAIRTPKVAVFEGKRLTTQLEKKRQCEYVYGHEKNGKHVTCGGIERFKLKIHGSSFNQAGMIGYIQDGTPLDWYNRVNGWISVLAENDGHEPKWSDEERLMSLEREGKVFRSCSIVYRHDSEINLAHLWIDLTDAHYT